MSVRQVAYPDLEQLPFRPTRRLFDAFDVLYVGGITRRIRLWVGRLRLWFSLLLIRVICCHNYSSAKKSESAGISRSTSRRLL